MLALYQDEQETLYQHIQGVCSGGNLPVTGIPKYSSEDTTLATLDSHGNKVMVAVPKDADISIDVAGLHYNPRYWKDPLSFMPSRFLDKDWPRDAFLPFSAGARACLGRKFFETEGIAILTMLVSRYKIEVKDELQFVGETFEQRKERILASRPGLTLT
ncbi:hypothetical protein H0H93_002788 [Arthromyces matolae]|nr:hypothetical protein H0H93_002788 [Arthromyces matolae]